MESGAANAWSFSADIRLPTTLEVPDVIQLRFPHQINCCMMVLSGLYTQSYGTLSVSSAVLKKNTALQEQDGTVFSGTVLENLFIDVNRTEEAKALLVDMGFEKAIDYKVEPEGRNLSPGERKKLLLVRALMKKAPFLLLDEPLNHLDGEGKESLVRQLMKRRSGILLISHGPYLQEQLPFSTFEMKQMREDS